MSEPFTKYGQQILEDLQKIVHSFYTRTDIEIALDEYRNVDNDEHWTMARQLREIFKAQGLTFTDDEREQERSLSYFPANADAVVNKLIAKIHDIQSTFPRGKAFLSRVLDNYADSADRKNFRDGDSLRLKLLKIFAAKDENNPFFGCMNAADLTEEFINQKFGEKWREWIKTRFAKTENERALLVETRKFTTAAKDLSLREKHLCEYLARFFAVDNNEKGQRRDDIYREQKAQLVLEKGKVFAVLDQLLFSCEILSIREFVKMLRSLAKEQHVELPDKIKKQLIESFALLRKESLPSTVEIFDAILGNGDIALNWSNERRKILGACEREIASSNPTRHEIFKEHRLKLHFEELKDRLKKSDNLIGKNCGLDRTVWENFFNEQLANNRPNMPLCTTLEELTAVADNAVESKHKEIVSYLKQFPHRTGDTFGKVFRKAWARKKNNDKILSFLKAVDDLANLRFDSDLNTKKMLYRLTLLLDLPSEDPIGVVEEIFDDVYSDNFFREGELRFTSSPISEGIRWRNPEEAVFLYFLTRRDLSAEARLKGADQMLEFLDTERHRGKHPEIVPSDNTKFYAGFFFREMINLQESDFQERLIRDYDICSSRDQRSAVKVYNELGKKNKELDGYSLNSGSLLVTDLIENLKAGEDENFRRLLERLAQIFAADRLPPVATKGVNRTDLIVFFYVDFVNRRLKDFENTPILGRNLIFLTFIKELDKCLDEANFKSFNVKSVVDLMTLTLLYAEILNR